MNVILFDDITIRKQLLPLTFTRPIAELRVGILKLSEKWQKYLNATISFETENYLSNKYPRVKSENTVYINGAVCANSKLANAIKQLSDTEILVKGNTILAYKDGYISNPENCKPLEFTENVTIISQKHDIFVNNGQEIKNDFQLITQNRKSQTITDKFTAVYAEENIFIEEGAKIKACVLNAESGPIYIGKNAEIKEGSLIRGPFAILENSMLNLGSKIQGDTTVGPNSKIGGEVSNCVIFGYSNKVHDGFIGNTVIGEWCNLGADTNTSNLKNNYSNIKVWNYATNDYENTQRQFHGLIMGDYSKAGINTMFNTGTVVGVSANIFGGGFPNKFIPSFTWGGCESTEEFKFELAIEAIERVYERRNLTLDNNTKNILKHIFDNDKLSKS